MSKQGYTRCHSGHCLYLKKKNDGSCIILLLYVDDILVAGSNMQGINVLKGKLENSFAMKDLGAAKQILGMIITRDMKKHILTLSQSEYVEKVLERFNMHNEKPVSTPLARHFKLRRCVTKYRKRWIICVKFHMHAMVFTRPEIAHAMRFVGI